jgi:hypothetical protein
MDNKSELEILNDSTVTGWLCFKTCLKHGNSMTYLINHENLHFLLLFLYDETYVSHIKLWYYSLEKEKIYIQLRTL